MCPRRRERRVASCGCEMVVLAMLVLESRRGEAVVRCVAFDGSLARRTCGASTAYVVLAGSSGESRFSLLFITATARGPDPGGSRLAPLAANRSLVEVELTYSKFPHTLLRIVVLGRQRAGSRICGGRDCLRLSSFGLSQDPPRLLYLHCACSQAGKGVSTRSLSSSRRQDRQNRRRRKGRQGSELYCLS